MKHSAVIALLVLAPAIGAAAAAGDDSTAGPASQTGFREIVGAKIGALPAEDPARRGERLLADVEHVFALYPPPPGGLTLPESFGEVVESFVAGVLESAQAPATARGDARVRATDVDRALQIVIPDTVDGEGDVTFFPALPSRDQVAVTAQDLEAFRRSGLQWRLVAAMLDEGRLHPVPPPDAAAADALAEGITRYGVLVLRIAGRTAIREAHLPFLRDENIAQAAREVSALAKLDSKAAGQSPRAARTETP